MGQDLWQKQGSGKLNIVGQHALHLGRVFCIYVVFRVERIGESSHRALNVANLVNCIEGLRVKYALRGNCGAAFSSDEIQYP